MSSTGASMAKPAAGQGAIVVAVAHRDPYVTAGYLLQDCSRHELVSAVRCVAGGGRYVGALVAERLLDSLGHVAPTGRELQVLQLMARGLRNREIGAALGAQVRLRGIAGALRQGDAGNGGEDRRCECDTERECLHGGSGMKREVVR